MHLNIVTRVKRTKLYNKWDLMSCARISKTHKQDLLMSSLQDFYIKQGHIHELLKIIQFDTKISLRIIDWFVTNYSKKNNTNYMIDNSQFIVYISYKLQLKGYSKKQFDPFCRRERLHFFYNNKDSIVTTVGQLNFFRWAIKNKVIKYIQDNIHVIENDMNTSYKAIYATPKTLTTDLSNETPIKSRRKRQELSMSATRTVNKHNVQITVSFD